MKVVTNRLTTTNAAKTSAQPTSETVGIGNLHAEADEEERDEEIAQAGDLGGDIERVGKGRERDAGDERAHFAREVQALAEFPDAGSTRRARRPAPVPAGARRAGKWRAARSGSPPSAAATSTTTRSERDQQDARREVLQIRLDREKEDRREILEHEHAERDAAGQRVEFLLVVEHLDDDDRAAQRRRRRAR